MMTWTRLAIVFVLSLPLVPDAQALVIISGNGLGNSTVEDDRAFELAFRHVSPSQLCNATYLGHGVVIGVAHQKPKKVRFGGVWYGLENAPTERLDHADLVLKRIVGRELPDDILPTLHTTSTTPAVGTMVYMVSGGYHRAANPTHWGIQMPNPKDPKTWVWTENAQGPHATAVGFKTIEPREQVLRWGTNTIHEIQGEGSRRVLITRFDPPGQGGTIHEAQGSGWDSGGAVFVRNAESGQWELAGLMTSVAGFPNMPDPRKHAVLQVSATVIADLAPHRKQIVRFMVTPESEVSQPTQGDDVMIAMLGGVDKPGGLAVRCNADQLKLAASYQTVFADMAEAYHQTQDNPFKSFDLAPAGAPAGPTVQLWRLRAEAGSCTGPITITARYDPAHLGPDTNPSRLAVFTYDDNAWHALNTQVDLRAGTITFTAPNLTTFVLGLRP